MYVYLSVSVCVSVYLSVCVSVFYVLCFMFYVLCFMFYVLCFVFCVICFMFCVLCFVFCVLCFMFCVLCFVFCVLCFMFVFKNDEPILQIEDCFWEAITVFNTNKPLESSSNFGLKISKDHVMNPGCSCFCKSFVDQSF